MSRLIKIYGERNTITTYISKLIHLNLDAEELPGLVPPYVMTLQKKLPGKDLVKDLYFFLSYKHNLGWKHTRVKSTSELKNYDIVRREICFVTITKNPYSWLLSLYSRPHHQYYRSKRDFETFLRTPWKTVGRDNCKKLLKNPIELWNIKNASYLPLADLNALNLRTERILENPKSIIEEISKHFSIDRLTSEFVNYEQSTKEKSKNFEYYQNYYLNEKWRDHLSEEAISIINEAVDKNLMSHFGYEVLP